MNVENYDSYNRLAPDGIVFDAAFIGYARGAYVEHHMWCEPDASPIFADPALFPPVLIAVGTEDPLHDQSDRLQRQLREKGVYVEFLPFAGMPHCFYSFPGLYAEEIQCYEAISRFVQRTRTAAPAARPRSAQP
jgi:acetyl esterase